MQHDKAKVELSVPECNAAFQLGSAELRQRIISAHEGSMRGQWCTMVSMAELA